MLLLYYDISLILFLSGKICLNETLSRHRFGCHKASSGAWNRICIPGQNKEKYNNDKSRAIKCFDTIKPTLNAAVSDGLLSVQVHDTDSGAKAVYVNGYEFTDLTNRTLNIRLQQFDAGYEYFTISAMDNAGNMSEVYKTKIHIIRTRQMRVMKSGRTASGQCRSYQAGKCHRNRNRTYKDRQ